MEQAVVAGAREVLVVAHGGIFVAEPDAVDHHGVAVGRAGGGHRPGDLGELAEGV